MARRRSAGAPSSAATCWNIPPKRASLLVSASAVEAQAAEQLDERRPADARRVDRRRPAAGERPGDAQVAVGLGAEHGDAAGHGDTSVAGDVGGAARRGWR